jgi:hypothetical protein
VLRLRRGSLRAVRDVVRLLAAGVVAAVLLAGCGGGGGSSSKKQTVTAPPELTGAESARFCQGLGASGCQTINTMVENWLGKDHLDNSHAVGALYFAVSGCLNCHTYQKNGSQSLKAPDLTHVGGSLSEAQIIAVLHCPTCVKHGSQMPSYRSLPPNTIRQIALFLSASH